MESFMQAIKAIILFVCSFLQFMLSIFCVSTCAEVYTNRYSCISLWNGKAKAIIFLCPYYSGEWYGSLLLFIIRFHQTFFAMTMINQGFSLLKLFKQNQSFVVFYFSKVYLSSDDDCTNHNRSVRFIYF